MSVSIRSVSLTAVVLSALCLGAPAGHDLPLFFVPNAGQRDASIKFTSESPAMHAGFLADGALLRAACGQIQILYHAAARPEGMDAQPGRANFFLGSSEGITDVPVYGGIAYGDLYPGITLRYRAARDDSGSNGLKSEFLVAAGADPAQIRMTYRGGVLSVDANGDLVVRMDRGEFREKAPLIYQESPEGRRLPVRGAYRMVDAETVTFDIAPYDRALPLVIDPTITMSSYLSGSGLGAVTGIAADSGGNLYLTGWTDALDFPIAGALQASNLGGVDTFVAKVSSAGALIFATYIGGNGDDRAAGIAIDGASQVYVAGSTASPNFPLKSAASTSFAGGREAFALKLVASGSSLVYSTYLGGIDWDAATAVAVDTSGNAYVAGDTRSTNFPQTGGVQQIFGGIVDAFVTKLTAAGAITWSTFLGGSGTEHAGGVAVSASGNVYVAGGTNSTNFPVVAAFQSANHGGQDAFLTMINAAGTAIQYSTYLGGTGGNVTSLEQANAIAVDSAGAAYVAGITSSTDFPATVATLQTANAGQQDAFVAKFTSAGLLQYCTYLGGTGLDSAAGIAVDSGGNAYVGGYTSSVDLVQSASVQPAFNGLYDGFITALNSAGNSVFFSTYYGGTGLDVINALAIGSGGLIYAGGQTSSLDLALVSALQIHNVSGTSGWFARIGLSAGPAPAPAAGSLTPGSGSGNTVTFTAQYSHPSGVASLVNVALLVNSSASTAFACYVTYNLSANRFTIWSNSGTSGSTVVPGGGSAQNSQCTLNGAASFASTTSTVLTLTVSLTFLPGFSGNQIVYMYAADSSMNTGWVPKGTWAVTIPAPQPSVDSVSPNNNTGSNDTFTFVFSDSQNSANLTGMGMLFNTAVNFTNACYVVTDRVAGTVALTWDNAGGTDSKPIASAQLLENSQCRVGTVTSKLAGLSVIVTVAVTFKGGFSGQKGIFMYAADGAINTGWNQKGSYNVVTGGAPHADSVVPGSGFGPSQRFSFSISDPGGSGFMTGMAMLIASTFSTANACSIVYDRTTNTVSLGYDNPGNGAAPLAAGTNLTVSNSQCILKGLNTTLVIGTTNIVVTVDIQFIATFTGPKNVYLYAAEVGANSGWSTVGTWNVTGGAPTADSMSPASGNTGSQVFAFTVSDSTADLNITGMSMLFTTGSPANIANTCYLVYSRTNSTIGLYNNAGTALGLKGIGSSATLQNSQCAVGFTVINTTGNSVVFSISLVFFSPAFSGAKSVYLMAQEPATNSGWVSRGTWTVP